MDKITSISKEIMVKVAESFAEDLYCGDIFISRELELGLSAVCYFDNYHIKSVVSMKIEDSTVATHFYLRMNVDKLIFSEISFINYWSWRNMRDCASFPLADPMCFIEAASFVHSRIVDELLLRHRVGCIIRFMNVGKE